MDSDHSNLGHVDVTVAESRRLAVNGTDGRCDDDTVPRVLRGPDSVLTLALA